MPLLKLSRITLNVLDEGVGSPLLLVHGFPLDHTMWNQTLPLLCERFRVIAPDLRGFGKSPWPDDDWAVTPGSGTIPTGLSAAKNAEGLPHAGY